MHICHLEASLGWGGQEIRALKEAQAMRKRGHHVTFITAKGAQLASKASDFEVHEISFEKKHTPYTLFCLLQLLKKADVVVTHSSWDAWIGGIAARLLGKKIVRLRHLSTPIRGGLNAKILYKGLADYVVTTCQKTADAIRKQAHQKQCRSIPTGIDPQELKPQTSSPLPEHPFKLGTACVFRSWKGLTTLLEACALMSNEDFLLVLIGDGPMRPALEKMAKEKNIPVHFTGYLDNPYAAMADLDLFLLLSTAHEGVSQATLQAALLEKPLITTSTGGLDEVCLHEQTGIIVPKNDPRRTAEAIISLKYDAPRRKNMGEHARALVLEKFTLEKMVDEMEKIFLQL